MRYRDDPESDAHRIGQTVYRTALEDRRGFRPDQIGIPEDDDVWGEIFEDLGLAVLAALSTMRP